MNSDALEYLGSPAVLRGGKSGHQSFHLDRGEDQEVVRWKEAADR